MDEMTLLWYLEHLSVHTVFISRWSETLHCDSAPGLQRTPASQELAALSSEFPNIFFK